MKSILLVDDDASIRDMIGTALRLGGIPVVEAADGEEAVVLLGRSPDTDALVIMDVLIPGLDGFGVLAEMKLINPRVRVLFVSASHALQDHSDPCVVDFVRKPFSPQELVSRVRSFLSIAIEDTGVGAQPSIAPRRVEARPRQEGARQ